MITFIHCIAHAIYIYIYKYQFKHFKELYKKVRPSVKKVLNPVNHTKLEEICPIKTRLVKSSDVVCITRSLCIKHTRIITI